MMDTQVYQQSIYSRLADEVKLKHLRYTRLRKFVYTYSYGLEQAVSILKSFRF